MLVEQWIAIALIPVILAYFVYDVFIRAETRQEQRRRGER